MCLCLLEQTGNVGLTKWLKLLESCVRGRFVAGALAMKRHAFAGVEEGENKRKPRVSSRCDEDNAFAVAATIDAPLPAAVRLCYWADITRQRRIRCCGYSRARSCAEGKR